MIQDWVYFVNASVYIARNPELAGLAAPSKYPFSSAIFLYKTKHPLQEFEQFRSMFEEPYEGYFEDLKVWIKAKQDDERITTSVKFMTPKRIGRPKK